MGRGPMEPALKREDTKAANVWQAPLWTTTAHDVDPVKPGARKLAGTKPARTNRDPALITRRRKALR